MYILYITLAFFILYLYVFKVYSIVFINGATQKNDPTPLDLGNDALSIYNY